MAERLTVPDKLLLAALKLREQKKTFTAEDLVVSAWKLYRDTFGLAGYSNEYPDSNRVLTNIMGTKGMRGKGWLRKVGEKQYRLTSKGLQDGTLLLGRNGDNEPTNQEYLRAELRRETAAQLDRLLNTKAARKALGEEYGEVTFTDACGFWDITARSNANVLNMRLHEVAALLERAKEAIEMAGGSHGLQVGSRELTPTDVRALIGLHKQMQESFASELDVLRDRTDERGEKRRRSL